MSCPKCESKIPIIRCGLTGFRINWGLSGSDENKINTLENVVWGPMADSCEHGIELSGFIKCEFLE